MCSSIFDNDLYGKGPEHIKCGNIKLGSSLNFQIAAK